jgi:hypothetical protein
MTYNVGGTLAEGSVRIGAVCFLVLLAAPAVAQPSIPRTSDGRPDFQGVWSMSLEARLERPDAFPNLVLTPEEAAKRFGDILKERARPGNLDFDSANPDFTDLMRVRGEYRSSIIVEPVSGKLPLTEAATDGCRQGVSQLAQQHSRRR